MESIECETNWSNNSSSSCNCSRASSCSKCLSSGSNTESGACSSRVGDQSFSRLPKEIITHIFKFLNYDQIAQLRPVCKTFDDIGKNLLNEGFYELGELHGKSLKKIKAQLPRRESERRLHRLSRHGEILSGIETRLNLLSMTYVKFMDRNLCCFIPGKVIDEVRRLIRLVNRSGDADLDLGLNAKPSRETKKDFPREHHEELQELRDISSMAMEHFEECIQPQLRAKLSDRSSGGITDPFMAEIVEPNDTVLGFTPGFRITSGSPVAPPCTVSIYQIVAAQGRKVAQLESKVKELKRRDREREKKLQEYQYRMVSSTASMTKLSEKMAELEKQVAKTCSMWRRDSCEVSTSRGTRFNGHTESNDLGSGEFQPSPKKSRRNKT